MIKRIWAYLTNGELVWLQDHDGEVTLTIARRTVFNTLIAKRYWPFDIKIVILSPDGNVLNGGYVRKWKRE